MQSFTDRQVWKVLRGLVSDNNAEIRKVFSASVAGSYNAFASSVDKEISSALPTQKKIVIGDGVREIYKQIANKLFEFDPDAKQKYFSLNSEGVVWQDMLSSRDLFYLYSFQNRVLRSFSKVENLNLQNAVSAVSNTSFGKYFSGKVEFTGKPQKNDMDKKGFDAKSGENIEGVLLQVSLNEHQRYCNARNLDPDATEQQMIEKVRFGEYTGGVVMRYFKQKGLVEDYLQDQDFSQELAEQIVTHPQFGKQVGFTEQGAPLYEDKSGRFTSSTGETYSGHIFGFNEDTFVVTGTTFNQSDIFPTQETVE